eukprot:s282_g4.t1
MSATDQKISPDAKHAAKPVESKELVKPKASKPRIDCIDGCRFALVFPIVENVLVGGFFVISGYVSAYTTTKLGALGVEEKKVANPELFFWQRERWGVSLLQKVSYSETARFHSSKEHPVDGKVMMPLIWNLTRFHPIWALFEMTTGIIAARHVMLDTEEDKRNKPMNPIWLFLAAYSSLALRLTKFDFNDAIIRGVLFVPLFTEFLTAMHRDALTAQPSAITRFFGCKIMATLGSLAFPMFIVHGPIGQIFYKKAIAKKLWGKPMPHAFFPFYLAICLGLSHLVNEHFVKNKKVGAFAGKVAQKLAGGDLLGSQPPGERTLREEQEVSSRTYRSTHRGVGHRRPMVQTVDPDAKAAPKPVESKELAKPAKASKPRPWD